MRALLLSSLTALVVLALSTPGIISAALTPAEVDWIASIGTGSRIHELAAQLEVPSAVVARLAGALPLLLATAWFAHSLISGGSSGWLPALVVGCSPGAITLAAHAGPESLVAAFITVLMAVGMRAPKFTTAAATLAVIAPLMLLISGPASGCSIIGAAAGTWGVWFGGSLAPWRPELAVPFGLSAITLAFQGCRRHGSRRWLALLVINLAAAGLGASGPLEIAAVRGAVVAPCLWWLVAVGAGSLPTRLPMVFPVTMALTAGFWSALDLAARRDLLDPSRGVEWDQAARMLAVLSYGDTYVIAVPPLPSSLTYYATLPATAEELPETIRANRVVVVSHGLRGGLTRATSAMERELEGRGYRLRGELELGPHEPGLVRLYERLTRHTAAPAYLRIRRFELPPSPNPASTRDPA